MHRRTLVALASAAVTAAALSAPAFAQTGEIRIAHVYSKTGPLEAYGKQTQTGPVSYTHLTLPTILLV